MTLVCKASNRLQMHTGNSCNWPAWLQAWLPCPYLCIWHSVKANKGARPTADKSHPQAGRELQIHIHRQASGDTYSDNVDREYLGSPA